MTKPHWVASRHFSEAEFIASEQAEVHGIDNEPPDSIDAALIQTRLGCERIRAFLGAPMQITSGYRCPELNQAVGGERDSQHMKGEAVDFVCPVFGGPEAVATALAPAMQILGIDQLIWEPTWVHVSFSVEPRYQALKRVGKKYVPLA
jgi:zinc D-Ala-D-Ala carboxypeptidase